MSFMTRDPDLATRRQRRIGAVLLLALLSSPIWAGLIVGALTGA